MNDCYFCPDSGNVIVASLRRPRHRISRGPMTKELRMCHVCFNQARYCDDGLDWNGHIIEIG